MFGTAGIIGTIAPFGRPEALILGTICWGGTAEDGVVGCVDKTSEGGCELEGVFNTRRSLLPSVRVGPLANGVASVKSSSSVRDPRRDGS